MNYKEAIMYGRDYLKENKIEDNDLIPKILISYICKIPREKLIVNIDKEMEKEKLSTYKLLLDKIANGVPLQYITNKQEFMNIEFYVDENVLIPQPDTEILVEEIIKQYKDKQCKILDLCTGSGAIAVSLAKNIEKSKIYASDISTKAIQIAKLNSERNLVHKKIEFIESNMFENIKEYDFDVIVSNPPYIKTSVINTLDKQVKNEPYIALDGGDDGLKFYKIITQNAYKYLKKNGKLYLEIGYDQKDSVSNILNKDGNYKDIISKKDLGGNDRIIIATVGR